MRRRTALLVATSMVVVTAGGCRTVGPSAIANLGRSNDGPSLNSAFSYLGGRAAQSFAQPPVTVQPAVVAALDDLRIEGVRQINEGGVVVFEGTTPDKRKCSVTLRPRARGSHLSARIGLFGDEPLSRALMDRVGVRLGALPPSAIPVDPPSDPGTNPYFSRDAVPDAVMLRDQAEAPFRGTAVP